MSAPDRQPEPWQCSAGQARQPFLVTPREVPLGGIRALPVRRTLPTRQLSLIGAWCFLDHYGPTEIPMSVAPHPHTGLQTVSWLFSGEVVHRDSAGNHAVVRPGELNLMTAGRGISHSEVSAADGVPLHGAQLWIALPDADRHGDPGLSHFAPDWVDGAGWRARVFLGETLGAASPVATATEVLGAELTVAPGARLTVPVRDDFEYGVLTDVGTLTVQGHEVSAGALLAVPPGAERIELTAGAAGARCLLLGGRPLGEDVLMWWNFVGREHDEIVAFRVQWQAQILQPSGQPVTSG